MKRHTAEEVITKLRQAEAKEEEGRLVARMLELVRLQAIVLWQGELFGPIVVAEPVREGRGSVQDLLVFDSKIAAGRGQDLL